MRYIGEKKLEFARRKIASLGYRPFDGSAVAWPETLVWFDHDNVSLYAVKIDDQFDLDDEGDGRHCIVPREKHPSVTGEPGAAKGFVADAVDLFVGPFPRPERPSDGSPECTTCKSRSLLDHEGWCEEGHLALQEALRDARKREEELRGFALWLADCHAATAEYDGTLKSTSRSRRHRFMTICQDAVVAIERIFGAANKQKYPYEDKASGSPVGVRDRLARAIDRIEADIGL